MKIKVSIEITPKEARELFAMPPHDGESAPPAPPTAPAVADVALSLWDQFADVAMRDLRKR